MLLNTAPCLIFPIVLCALPVILSFVAESETVFPVSAKIFLYTLCVFYLCRHDRRRGCGKSHCEFCLFLTKNCDSNERPMNGEMDGIKEVERRGGEDGEGRTRKRDAD